MKFVHEALTRREGNLIAGYLCDLGIPAEVLGGAFQSLEGEVTNIRGILPRICVLNDSDAERARDCIAAYLAMVHGGVVGDPWLCPQCGETLEPQFLSCWQCQTANPGLG